MGVIMKRLWTLDEDETLKNLYPSLTNKELAEILNRTPDAVRGRAKVFGLKKNKQRSWSKEEIAYLEENYRDNTISVLMECLQRSRASIFCKADDLGITISSANRGQLNFFKTIDTEEKAYWLGFIYADGYVTKGEGNSELGIELSVVDIAHLEKFNKVFNNYYNVTAFKKRPNSHNAKGTEMCGIRIYSREVVNDLINSGVVENKTKSTTFPIVEDDNLFFHFLRGYIDGDGSYSIKTKVSTSGVKHKYPRVSIVGNCYEVFEHIVARLKEFNITARIYEDRGSYKLQVSRSKDCKLLMDLLYNKATIFLERKHNKVQEITKLAVLSGDTQNN